MKQGFSLIEMLIAVVVLAIAVMGIAQVFPLGMRSVFMSQMYTKATEYAEEVMENLRTTDYSDFDVVNSGSGGVGEDHFFMVWNVSPDGIPVQNCRFATVDIYWAANLDTLTFNPSEDDFSIHIHLESYIANLQWQ